jgi:hypothetical protein
MKSIIQNKQTRNVVYYCLFMFAVFFAGGASVYLNTSLGQEISKAFGGIGEWQKAAEAERVEMEEIEKQKGSELVITLLYRKEGAHTGFTLFNTSDEQTARLIDMNGKIVHQWHKPFNESFPKPDHVTKPKGRINWSDTWLFPNGDLIAQYNGALDTPYGYGQVKMDKDSNLIWNYSTNSHHSFDVDAEGRIYGLSQKWYKKPIPDFPFITPPALLDSIYVLTPDGKELYTVELIEAFRNSPYRDMLNIRDTVFRNVGDYMHTNSIMIVRPGDVKNIPGVKPGMVLVSLRNPDVIGIVDLEKKQVVWATKGKWKQQHSAYFAPNGTLGVFDNQGWGKRRSRVIEFDPLTLEETWSFPKNKEDKFFCPARGRTSLLPNGNVLIIKSTDGRIVEVDRNSNPVWEIKVERRQQNGKTERQMISGALRYTKEQLPFMDGTEP